MSAKRTPGPWVAVMLGGGKGGPNSYSIRLPETEDGAAAIAHVHSKPGGVAGWNAKLIAAAPDLAEALRDCDSAFVGWQVGQVPGRPKDILALVVKVRAALAKAGVL